MAQRMGDHVRGVTGFPQLQPRAHALLQIGDDFVGNTALDIADRGHFSVSFGFEAQRCTPVPFLRLMT
jgi:hypothetical protein